MPTDSNNTATYYNHNFTMKDVEEEEKSFNYELLLLNGGGGPSGDND